MSDSPPANVVPALPADVPPTGTIDITNLVGSLQDSFIKWATDFVYVEMLTVPALSWLGWSVIGIFSKFIIELVIRVLAGALVMRGFFLNTAIRKASQAQDYVDAVKLINGLPPTATDKEYENAEKAEMAAFRNFVLISN